MPGWEPPSTWSSPPRWSGTAGSCCATGTRRAGGTRTSGTCPAATSRPGGPRAALRRELLEELGVDADVEGHPVWTLVDDGLDLSVWRVGRWTGEPAVVDGEEHDDLGWFTRDEALRLDLADDRYPQLLEVLLG